MSRKYQVISGDSHLDIPYERWVNRVDAKWRDRAPKLISLPDGTTGYIVENRRMRGPSEGMPYRIRTQSSNGANKPGTGSPAQRLQEQDEDGVDAEILFTHTHAEYWRGISDDEAFTAVIHAYNEWLAEEYCSHAPDRLIAIGLIPSTNLEDALAELEFCSRIGLKGVHFVAFPSGKTYPTPEDDAFWRRSLELGMALTAHTAAGANRFGREGPLLQYSRRGGRAGGDPMEVLVRFVGGQALVHLQLAMSGVFDRFPDLKVYWAETQVGWLPFALKQIDDNFEQNRYLAEQHYGFVPPLHTPSYYIQRNGLWGFLTDPVGVRLRHDVGVNQLLWGSDFAHSASEWPYSKQVIEEIFAGVPEDERFRMLAGNAADYFGLDVNAELTATKA